MRDSVLANAHVSLHIPETSSHISAAWDKHRDWAIIRDLRFEGAAQTAKYGLP